MKLFIQPGIRTGIVIISFSLLATAFCMAGTLQSAGHASATSHPVVAAPVAKEAAPQAAPGASNEELIQGMKLDLAKMETLVSQMEVNLAHVESGQSFLKHQFELEIDTWKVMIASMQRRIRAMEKK